MITALNKGSVTWRKGARNADGFTLLELLVALTLLAVVLTFAFGGLRFGAKAWESGDRRIERLSEFQVAHRVVTRILSQAFPIVLRNDGGLRYAFEGTAAGVSFVAFMPHYPDVAGPYIIKLEIVKTDQGNELRLKRAPFTPSVHDLTLSKSDEDEPIFETPYRMTFSYFDAGEGTGDGAWVERWDHDARMPTKVRLRVFTPDDAPSYWPDLIARLVINMDSACLVADKENLCRLRK